MVARRVFSYGPPIASSPAPPNDTTTTLRLVLHTEFAMWILLLTQFNPLMHEPSSTSQFSIRMIDFPPACYELHNVATGASPLRIINGALCSRSQLSILFGRLTSSILLGGYGRGTLRIANGALCRYVLRLDVSLSYLSSLADIPPELYYPHSRGLGALLRICTHYKLNFFIIFSLSVVYIY